MATRVPKGGWGRHVTPYSPGPKRAPKYRNLKCEVDGFKFDSIKEAHRYGALKLLVRAGEIRNLRLQVRHPLTVNGVLIGHYVADFDYEERRADPHPTMGAAPAWEWHAVTEDVKGGEATQTDVFKLKAKIFAALYDRKVRIT